MRRACRELSRLCSRLRTPKVQMPVSVELALSNDPTPRAKQVLNTLLAGPVDAELRPLPPDAVLLAFYMLQEGVASAPDIDKAIKLGLNHPMGPLEMADLVGLDTRLHVLEYLHQSLGDKFRPCPLMIQYVKAGRLGRKSGKGVYEYPPQKK